MPRFTPYLTPRRTRLTKRSFRGAPDNVDIDMRLINNAFKTALNGFIAFDYQTLSLQSFQAEAASINASLDTGGSSERDVRDVPDVLSPPYREASTPGAPVTSTVYTPSLDDTTTGGSGDEDLDMDALVSHASSFEEDGSSSFREDYVSESQGFIAFDYQTVSLQSFQAGVSAPQAFIPFVDASLNTGEFRESDIPSQPFLEGPSAPGLPVLSPIFTSPSSEDTMNTGQPDDEDFEMDPPASSVSSFGGGSIAQIESPLLYTSGGDVHMDDWPLAPCKREGSPADACLYATADSLPGHYEVEPNPIADAIDEVSLTNGTLSLTATPVGSRQSLLRSLLRLPSFSSCLQSVLFAVLAAIIGVALSFPHISDSLARPTASVLTPTLASALELGRLESLVVELVGTVQNSHLEDKQFISNILEVVLDASSRSSKLMQRVSEVNVEVNERISTAKQLFSFSHGQLLFLRSTVNQRVEDVACDFEPKLAQLARSRGEIKEVQLYLDYLQEALLHLRRRLIVSIESSPRHHIIPIGIGALFGFKSSILRGANLFSLLDRVDAQRIKADLSLMSEAMVVTVQDGHIRGLKDRFAQVYPHVIKCS